MKRTPGRQFGCSLAEGQTGTVKDKLGETLVKAGLAVEVPEVLEAVPETPKVAGKPRKRGPLANRETKAEE